METRPTVLVSPGSKRTAVPGRDVEAHAVGSGAIELEGAIDLDEVVVAAD